MDTGGNLLQFIGDGMVADVDVLGLVRPPSFHSRRGVSFGNVEAGGHETIHTVTLVSHVGQGNTGETPTFSLTYSMLWS